VTPTGNTYLLPTKTIDAIMDAEEAILAGGRQLGTVGSTDFGRVIRNVDGEAIRIQQNIDFENRQLDKLKETAKRLDQRILLKTKRKFFGKELEDLSDAEILLMEKEGRRLNNLVAGFEAVKSRELIQSALNKKCCY
jgi:hypothetical protein